MKTTYPDALMYASIWISLAVMVVAMAHCNYKKEEAYQRSCEHKECVRIQ